MLAAGHLATAGWPARSSASNRYLDRVGHFTQSPVGFRLRQCFLDPSKGRKRLSDHLVHVIVTIGREPPDKPYIPGTQRQALIALEQFGVFRPRHRIKWIAVVARIFVGEA